MSQAPIILWLRRDLRLSDNTALNAALATGAPVLPVLVLDPVLLNSSRMSVPRRAFYLAGVQALQERLNQYGATLVVREGQPATVLAQLAAQTGAQALYYNREYSPYARRRDAAVQSALDIPIQRFDDALLVPPGHVLTAAHTPYTVFTPFKRAWLARPKPAPYTRPFLEQNAFSAALDAGKNILAATIQAWPSYTPCPEATEAAAQARLAHFIQTGLADYQAGRDRLAAAPDTDHLSGSSFLSPYFRLGLLSIREAYAAAQAARQTHLATSAQASIDTWISELAWREFYQHILYHFPHVLNQNFRPAYDQLAWRNAPDEFQAWQEGYTGYPVVDAAMRQLRQTGWMPNRARMIVASFLTKDLLLDWRWGERYFMQMLLDGDTAANNGGWQWSAGTGTDAQPYFRIFNPVAQSQKFDPAAQYLQRWLPELHGLPPAACHAPWELAHPPAAYPPPLVDHAFARQRTLAAFNALKAP